METKTVQIEVKAGPEDGLEEGEFIVYPSTFIKEPDSYGDIVKPGAFADTIAEWTASGNVMPALFGHRFDDPDFFVGGALGKDMSEDDHGWRVKGKFSLDSPKGKTVYNLVKDRHLTQLSFAYDTLDEGQVELEDGRTVNELRKLKVYEFSFVPIGANTDTSVVAVKLARDLAAKAGRVISAKNEDTLKAALESLETSAAQIKDVLSQLGEATPNEDEDQAKAAAEQTDNDEGLEVKSEIALSRAPADALELEIAIKRRSL